MKYVKSYIRVGEALSSKHIRMTTTPTPGCTHLARNQRILAAVGILGRLDLQPAMPLMSNAACRSEYAVFDAAISEYAAQLEAVELCRQCSELTPCGVWLDSLPKIDRPTRGVVAGRILHPLLSPEQRADCCRKARVVQGRSAG